VRARMESSGHARFHGCWRSSSLSCGSEMLAEIRTKQVRKQRDGSQRCAADSRNLNDLIIVPRKDNSTS
jgi:hypothetical protein